jgi:hypothetical protein
MRAKCARFFVLLGVLLLASACSRTQSAAPKPPPPPLEYIGEWGVKGDGPGQLSRPTAIATDSLGNVYVADAGSAFVHKFSGDGGPLLSFQDDFLKQPESIAVDGEGAIYVGDPKRHSIVVFHPDGKRLRDIRCVSQGRLQQPTGIVVDDDANIFVAEPDSGRIQKFNRGGHVLKAWEMPRTKGNANQSSTAEAIGPDGSLYLAENDQVLKFTPEGALASSWTYERSAEPVARLSGLAVSNKYVFAAEAEKWRVHVWSLDGQPKLTYDLERHSPDSAANLTAIAVGSRNELLALDGNGARILRFRINF